MNRLIGLLLLLLVFSSSFAQNSERPVQPDLPGDIVIDIGFNRWDNNPDLLPTKMIGSNSFSIYYNRRTKISDKFSFYTAVGYTNDKFSIDNRNNWFRADDGNVILDSLTEDVLLRKNKLGIHYLEVPVELRFHPFGTINGEGFFVGIGAIGGVRIGASTKVKYDTGEDTHKERLSGQFGLNRWKYGLQARLGFKSVHVFYKMYFHDQFESLPYVDSVNPRMMTFGITVSGF